MGLHAREHVDPLDYMRAVIVLRVDLEPSANPSHAIDTKG
jgi:hypothetical protein